MKIVVDANVLFSILINHGKSAEIFLSFGFEVYCPEFLLEEFEKYELEILRKTKRSEEEFHRIFNMFRKIVTFIPKEQFKEYLGQAKGICPDPDDVMYFALALKLKCPIWSQDKRLKFQRVIKIYSTGDLVREFEFN